MAENRAEEENAVLVEEYLETCYRPDCDYLEGELLERNVGEWDHRKLDVSAYRISTY